MADQEILDGLNEIMSTEYTSMIQLMQHSFLMQGADRYTFAEVLRKHAKDTVSHARELGDKIVALGGVPSVHIGEVRQSTDTTEMLRQDLEQHRAAVAKIDEMVQKADERKMVALRVLLENMSFEETEFLEELEKALALKTVSIEDRGKGKVPRVKMV
ncbi:MAG: ferritin-like domain-containing protein [Actinomycetota bacterium]